MPVYKLEKSQKVRFRSSHRALAQVAEDISAGLPEEIDFGNRFTIFVGLHKGIGFPLLDNRIKVGIQTEQFLDEKGAPLWGMKKKAVRHLRWALRFCDYVLDLSEANRGYYEQEGFLKKYPGKFLFGPRIFPSVGVKFGPISNHRVVFYGTSGGRRTELLAKLPGDLVEHIPEGTFGHELSKQIHTSRAVLNIHYADGVYTEVPRVLSAYLSGKVLVSEELAPPFKSSNHYIRLADLEQVGAEKETFDRFSEFVTENLSFYELLKELAERNVV